MAEVEAELEAVPVEESLEDVPVALDLMDEESTAEVAVLCQSLLSITICI